MDLNFSLSNRYISRSSTYLELKSQDFFMNPVSYFDIISCTIKQLIILILKGKGRLASISVFEINALFAWRLD